VLNEGDEYVNTTLVKVTLAAVDEGPSGIYRVCVGNEEGGPSPGLKWCYDYAISKSAVPLEEWCTVGFTYDSNKICAYFNGIFGQLPNNSFREEIEYLKGNSLNPYYHDRGIFNGGKDGAGFTVGARTHDLDQTPAYFHGLIGGLAIFDRALSAEEMLSLGKKI